ncbi:hypothetical protein [Geothrix campi]|uniref:hypothetical protein n=1 Tax=Geothrix campi TaxID=2966450 RepID=UPI002148C215|nr:hypothetical protein [Geothrix sp. SG10]
MTRMARTLAALMFGGTLLMAQIPNPLNLPDPLGLSKKPAPAPAPRRDGGRVEQRPSRKHHDNGKHKGQDKREGGERGDRKGHGKH